VCVCVCVYELGSVRSVVLYGTGAGGRSGM